MERLSNRKYNQKEVVGLMPAQAIIDYDRAEEVIKAIALTAEDKILEQVIKWGETLCPNPNHKAKHGIYKRYCGECWQELKEESGKGRRGNMPPPPSKKGVNDGGTIRQTNSMRGNRENPL